jgi:hypothetical protein
LHAKAVSLALVSEVIITKGSMAEPESHIPFVLVWRIILRDGRNLTVEVSGSTNGDEIRLKATLH